MHSKPPSGFEELRQVAEKATDSEFCAVGVVTDFLPATKTKGTDYIVTFTLTDVSWLDGEGLKCRFFARTEEKLPNISSRGDVVVLRSVKLKRFNGQLLALSSLKSSWLVFHQQDIPTSNTETKGDLPVSKLSDQVPSPRKEMMDYAIALCNFLDRTTFGESAPLTTLQASNLLGSNGHPASPQPNKFQLIQDLVPPKTTTALKFADLLGEVRKIYSNDFRVELSITDYTSHEALYDYVHPSDDEQGRDGDIFNYNPAQNAWPGPWGKMSMVVTAWDAHAGFAREHVGLQSLVFLNNVQIGFDREGARMEGKLRGDRRYPDKINVTICNARQAKDDDRVKALLKRKLRYETEVKLHGIKGLEDSKRLKEESLQQPAKDQDLSRTEKGKNKKQRNKKRKEKETAEKAKKKEAQAATSHASKSSGNSPNSNIRTNKVPDTVTPVKIFELLDPSALTFDFQTPAGNPLTVPFKNNFYQLKNLRVIDYHPPNFADFAAPHKPSDYEFLSDYEGDSDIDMDMPTDANGAEVSWEWRFELLVEDASPRAAVKQDSKGRMKLLIAGKDADFLLRNIEATNLRKDKPCLAKLKEKLFLLWGDLQEQKEEEGRSGKPVEPSGRPFDCLVKEYGVQVRGRWERVFALFGTSIVSD